MHAQEDWDDTLILQIFHDSIAKHKTKSGKNVTGDNQPGMIEDEGMLP